MDLAKLNNLESRFNVVSLDNTMLQERLLHLHDSCLTDEEKTLQQKLSIKNIHEEQTSVLKDLISSNGVKTNIPGIVLSSMLESALDRYKRDVPRPILHINFVWETLMLPIPGFLPCWEAIVRALCGNQAKVAMKKGLALEGAQLKLNELIEDGASMELLRRTFVPTKYWTFSDIRSGMKALEPEYLDDETVHSLPHTLACLELVKAKEGRLATLEKAFAYGVPNLEANLALQRISPDFFSTRGVKRKNCVGAVCEINVPTSKKRKVEETPVPYTDADFSSPTQMSQWLADLTVHLEKKIDTPSPARSEVSSAGEDAPCSYPERKSHVPPQESSPEAHVEDVVTAEVTACVIPCEDSSSDEDIGYPRDISNSEKQVLDQARVNPKKALATSTNVMHALYREELTTKPRRKREPFKNYKYAENTTGVDTLEDWIHEAGLDDVQDGDDDFFLKLDVIQRFEDSKRKPRKEQTPVWQILSICEDNWNLMSKKEQHHWMDGHIESGAFDPKPTAEEDEEMETITMTYLEEHDCEMPASPETVVQ